MKLIALGKGLGSMLGGHLGWCLGLLLLPCLNALPLPHHLHCSTGLHFHLALSSCSGMLSGKSLGMLVQIIWIAVPITISGECWTLCVNPSMISPWDPVLACPGVQVQQNAALFQVGWGPWRGLAILLPRGTNAAVEGDMPLGMGGWDTGTKSQRS